MTDDIEVEVEDERILARPEVLAPDEKERYLPPIHRLKIPDMRVVSTKIRWLWALGYPVKEISRGLGIRYQQVRNIITTIPKRAAREDLPELTVEVMDVEDIVDTLLGSELDRTFMEARQKKVREVKASRRAQGIPDYDAEPSDEELFGDGEWNEGDDNDA